MISRNFFFSMPKQKKPKANIKMQSQLMKLPVIMTMLFESIWIIWTILNQQWDWWKKQKVLKVQNWLQDFSLNLVILTLRFNFWSFLNVWMKHSSWLNSMVSFYSEQNVNSTFWNSTFSQTWSFGRCNLALPTCGLSSKTAFFAILGAMNFVNFV